MIPLIVYKYILMNKNKRSFVDGTSTFDWKITEDNRNDRNDRKYH